MSVSDGCLIERYEQLRAQAMGRWVGCSSQLGLTLLLRQGLPAWLAAWSRYTPSERTDTAGTQDRGNTGKLLPPDGQAEVAMVLAGMALHHGRQMHG